MDENNLQIARRLVNAMILQGPENEDELILLAILLDPDSNIDAIKPALDYISKAEESLTNLLDTYTKQIGSARREDLGG